MVGAVAQEERYWEKWRDAVGEGRAWGIDGRRERNESVCYCNSMNHLVFKC